jgi:putative nucleotidyltransferase with HDIG domain
MDKGMLSDTLIGQEKRSAKLFLVLFYVTFFANELIFTFIFPVILHNEILAFDKETINSAMTSLILLGLLPIAIYFLKKNTPRVIKYIYFIVFILIMVISESIQYLGTDEVYASGNTVELLIVIFSPIFVNKRFFWLVFMGIMTKYLIIGFILHTLEVLIPMILICGVSIVAFILLNRFKGYVSSIGEHYSNQFENVVKGIIATIELKDPYTRGHSERVADYSEIMARQLGLFSEETLKTFYYACLLHDVGKIHIPDYILTKPGSLTDEEYEVIKQHPVVGTKAVQEIDGLQGTADVIRHHHERWDGKGYPNQLKELETPLLARITAIADAFDAMTTIRSYRKALSTDEAYKRIIEGKESQFDPHLVDVFVKVFPQWEKIANQDKEITEPNSLKEAGTAKL